MATETIMAPVHPGEILLKEFLAPARGQPVPARHGRGRGEPGGSTGSFTASGAAWEVSVTIFVQPTYPATCCTVGRFSAVDRQLPPRLA